jgi:hypothetical protein
MGKLMTQYRKSAKARLTMNIVVYFEGVMLNPGNFFLCAHGIARRVNKLPTAPTMATIMHLTNHPNI